MEGFAGPTHKYTDFFQPKKLTDYIQWKNKRKQLIKILGSRFLSVTEQELIQWYLNWEKEAFELAKSNIQSSLLSSLLLISILHYFQRDIQLIENYFSVITTNFMSTQREVAKVTASVLKFFAQENSEITVILKKCVTVADSIFQKRNKPIYYNALLILHSIAKFVTEDVFQVTTRIIPELLTCIYGSDEVIQNEAIKVLYIHVKYLPNELISFIEYLVLDCKKGISSSNESQVLGIILLIQKIYPIAHEYIDPKAFLSQMTQKLETLSLDLVIATVDFIIFFIKTVPDCFEESREQSTLTLLIQKCKQHPDHTELLTSLNNFLSILPPDIVPINDIIQLITTSIDKYKDIGFKVLNDILKQFPDQQLDRNIFKIVDPDIWYIKVLKRQQSSFSVLRSKLVEVFNSWIKKESPKHQMIALKILRLFGKSLFKNEQLPYETIKPLFHSKCENIRLEMMKTIRSLDLPTMNTELLRMAVSDPSKAIRLKAILQLDKCKEIIQTELLTYLLADRSYKVRRTALPIVWTLAKHNPLKTIPMISNFLKQILISETPPSNSARSAKACSLLPMIAKHLIADTPSFIPYLTWICVALLCGDEPFPSFPEDANQPFIDLRKVFNQDFVADDFTLSYSHKDPHLYQVFQIDNAKYSANRAKYLFDTLKILSPHIYNFIYQVIPVFPLTFQSKQPDFVLVSGLKALHSIISVCDSSISIIHLSVDLLPSLFQLLSEGCSDEVALYTLKVTGSLGVTSFSGFECPDSLKKQSYDVTISVNEHVMKYLCKDELTPRVLEVLAIIIAKTEDFCGVPYLDHIVSSLINTIETNNSAPNMFIALELIVWKYGFYLQPYLNIIEPILINFISEPSCVYLCCQLSYQFKTAFTQIAAQIYPMILNTIHEFSKDSSYGEPAFKLIALMITFQNQNFNLFLNNISHRISNGWKPPPLLLICILRILKFNDLSFFNARILQFCQSILSYTELSDLILQVIYFLILYSHLPINFIYGPLSKKYSKQIKKLEKKLSSHPYLINEISFVKNITLNLSNERLIRFTDDRLNSYDTQVINNLAIFDENDLSDNMLPKSISANNSASSNLLISPFSNIGDPTFNNSSKWLYEMTPSIFGQSPLYSIRSCSQLVLQSRNLRRDLFPIAFLSCWQVASKEDKRNISNTIANIFKSFSLIDPMLISIAETLERAGTPLWIPQDIIASCCLSPALPIYLLSNFWHKHKDSKEAVNNLLSCNSAIGRLDCVRGLLSQASNLMTLKDNGKWYEQLGEWSRALSLYESTESEDNGNDLERLSAIIRCYGHLEHWETIRTEFASLFDTKMSLAERQETALWFAWAFYHAHDFERVKQYTKYFSPNDIKQQIFTVLYLISSGQLDKAGPCIKNAFNILVSNKNYFNESDTGLATKLLTSALHLTELNEALKIKKKSSLKNSHKSEYVPKVWKNRLELFRHGSDAWMKLIEIRSLLLSPEEHVQSCLKLISNLRKERQWRLIESYFDRLFSSIKLPEVLLASIKIKYARGQFHSAISLLSCYNLYIDGQKTEMDSLFEEIAYPSPKLHAKFLRIQATVLYENAGRITYLIGNALEDAKKCFQRSLELNNTDYRSWSGLAYVSSKMINNSTENSVKVALATDAIISFFKAARLHPESSLEFLCQLLSHFFQYGDEVGNEVFMYVEKITSLPSYAISQVVPQLVGNIAHSSEKVRNVVRSMLECFGISHFESVFYSLNFSTSTEPTTIIKSSKQRNKEMFKSSMANTIMQKIQLPHTQKYQDALLFVDGLRKASINWFEQWITIIELALRFISIDDKKALQKHLNDQFDALKKPNSDYDSLFIKTFSVTINQCRELLAKNQIDQLRSTLIDFKKDIDAQLRRIDQIQLNKVSPQLAQKRHFEISIPGTQPESIDTTMEYHAGSNNASIADFNNSIFDDDHFYNEKVPNTQSYQNIECSYPKIKDHSSPCRILSPKIYMIDPTLMVLRTQQHPRSVLIIDEFGHRWRFLLKGNEDLRLDQRIMQLFKLINVLLSHDRLTSSLNISIAQYPIVPFAKDCGLIGWVGGADTLQHLVNEMRTIRNVPQYLEINMIHDLIGQTSMTQTFLQRMETFQEIVSKVDANELRDIFWIKSPNPGTWLARVDNYTKSTGLMSMTGYVIGLGDRHPSNMMVQRESGRVIHIDFGDSFESAKTRRLFPEKVPFRLTRMTVNAFDCAGIDGLFRKTCEAVMNVLREHKTSIIAQLEIFVHEPIFETSTAAKIAAVTAASATNEVFNSELDDAHEESKWSPQSRNSMLDRVSKKLQGQDPSPTESYSSMNHPFDEKKSSEDDDSSESFEWDVPEQVDRLINIAINPMNYMQHYLGWCPFW